MKSLTHAIASAPTPATAAARSRPAPITRSDIISAPPTVATPVADSPIAAAMPTPFAVATRPGHQLGRFSIHPPLPAGVQAKLTVSEPDDKYEQEADRVADTVMRMPEQTAIGRPDDDEDKPGLGHNSNIQTKPLGDQITSLVQRQEESPGEEEESVQPKFKDGEMIQRVCPECDEEIAQRQPMEEEEEELQAKSKTGETPEVTPAISSGIESLQGGGQPLSRLGRSFFEPRFGADFSKVRIHNDTHAASVARSVNARAFTLGCNVVFGAGEYSPDTLAGRILLAHELTHVVQQNGVSTRFSTRKNNDNKIPNPQESGIASPELPRVTPLAQGQEEPPEEEEESIHAKLTQRHPVNKEVEPIQARLLQRKMTDIRGIRPSRFDYVGPKQNAQLADIRLILRSTSAQAKLTIGQPNDKYEQEADRVAEEVMRMPDPKVNIATKDPDQPPSPLRIQRLCQECEEDQALQREPGEEEDASVTAIIDALEGITTANDSAVILAQFQGQGAARLRAILSGLKAKAPGHGVTPEGMIDWLFSDMTAEDSAVLRRLLIRAGVHRDINRVIVEELYDRLSGYTSDADSQEIYGLLVQYIGGGLDKLLEDLAAKAKMSGGALGAWLLGDLDRANAERVRVHFLTLGAANAADYAAEFTAAKIKSLLTGYTSHADSSSIIRNFHDTPQKHRPTVQAKLEAKTQASWGQSVADALMEDMGREDYEALRALGGVTIRAYDYTPTWYEKLISGAEWGMIVAEWIVCGVIGVITGIIGVIWDIVMILADAVAAIWHLLWSLVYLMTGRTFGSENWLKVKQFFAGLFEIFTNPSTAWDQYWESVGIEFRTIEGPLTDCRRAEFFMRKLAQAVLNIALIALAGYGIAKGIASAIKTAQAVARLRLLAGGVRSALRLVRLGGNGVDDVARIETLLASRKVASVGEIEALLSHAKVANTIELDALLSSAKVQSSAELQTLLDSQKLASAVQLQTLLSHVKLTSAAELQGILNSAKVTSAAEVQAVLDSAKVMRAAELQALLGRGQITSLAQIQSLFGHSKLANAAELDALLGNVKITSVAELSGLLNDAKISSAAELQGLLSDAKIANLGELRALLADPKIADAGQLQHVLGGTADVAELNRLLALVDDAAQLIRFQAAIGNSAEVERLIRTAGLGNPPVADASRLDRVLAQMGAGRHPIPAIETELAALKKLDSKILHGEPATPAPPGVAPIGPQREIRGVHSASVLSDPNFQIISTVNNADGTIMAKLRKLLYTDPATGTQTWSKTKNSTLAPASWTESDILAAGDRIAASPAVSGPRTWGSADGATMHRGVVNGVQWEVVKDAAGRVISSYPTGGKPSAAQF